MVDRYSIALPETFLFTASYRVLPDDINFANHLAAVRVLPIAIQAHADLLENIGLDPENSKFGLIMASSHIDYIAEAYLDDVLEIDIAVCIIDEKSFDFVFRIRDAETDFEIARAETRMLSYDYIMRRVVKTPVEFGEAIVKLSAAGCAA